LVEECEVGCDEGVKVINNKKLPNGECCQMENVAKWRMLPNGGRDTHQMRRNLQRRKGGAVAEE
jgi:hypothetical protein